MNSSNKKESYKDYTDENLHFLFCSWIAVYLLGATQGKKEDKSDMPDRPSLLFTK